MIIVVSNWCNNVKDEPFERVRRGCKPKVTYVDC